MLYIQKKRVSAAVSKEIRRVKQDNDWYHSDFKDAKAIRSVFDMMDKETIRTQLLKEQGYLCAYCMRKISNDATTTIEHLIPISLDGKQALNYKNMLACCDGGRGSIDKNKILCCDAAKGDKKLTISPFKKEQLGCDERCDEPAAGDSVGLSGPVSEKSHYEIFNACAAGYTDGAGEAAKPPPRRRRRMRCWGS